MYRDFIKACPTTIAPPAWDSRKVRRELSEGGLLDSIREIGIVQTPCVWSRYLMAFESVCGWRRIQCASYLFTVERDERFSQIDLTFLADISPQQVEAINLTENVQRDSLHSWELCLAYYELREKRIAEGMRDEDVFEWLSASTGQTEKHIRTLIRIREKLIPELWAMLVKFGLTASVGWNVLHDIAMLRSREEQIAEWQKKIDPSTCAARRGRERKPGTKKLERMMREVKSVPRSIEFRRGMREAFRVALGEVPWARVINPDADIDTE